MKTSNAPHCYTNIVKYCYFIYMFCLYHCVMMTESCNSFEHAVERGNEVIGGPIAAAEESVINTAGRPKCCRGRCEFWNTLFKS